MSGWTMDQLELGAPLAEVVTGAVGYSIDGLTPGVHVGLPGPRLTLILALDEPLVVARERAGPPARHWALVAGLTDLPAYVMHGASQSGVQLSLEPTQASRLLGLPVGALAGSIVDLEAMWPQTRRLLDRLHDARDMPTRAGVLRDELTPMLVDDGSSASTDVMAAWRMIEEEGGTGRISDLADRLGTSRRHLTARFRSAYGVTPKQAARVCRFHRAQREVADGHHLASVAARNGYADQAHMSREFSRLAGSPPRRWIENDVMAASL